MRLRCGVSVLGLLAACSGSIDGAKPGGSGQQAGHVASGAGTSSSAAGPQSSAAGSIAGSAGRGAGPAGGPSAVGAGVNAADGGTAFEALAPAVYVAKVKGQLTGLVATSDEIAQVSADPGALRGLIVEWQTQPEYATRMIDFFTTAFQQGDVTAAMIGNVTSYEQGEMDKRVIANMRESFGRTAMALVQENAPFTEVLTTRRLMLTPALMVAMTWLEERQSGDGGGVNDALNNDLGPDVTYTLQGDDMIPIEQSIDPASPNFLKFYSAQVAAATGDCHKPVVVDTKDNRLTLYTHTFGETIMGFFMGHSFGVGFCRYPALETVLGPSDFNTWRMMTIRKPRAGEKQTWLYDLTRFRMGNELVYPKPHVGFYTTPSFLYTWQTNDSNQARVTVNQTLIVATGRRFDGSLNVTPASDAAISKEHAKPDTECYGCHLNMDPMRQYFRNTYSYFWGLQDDRSELDKPGIFAFDGETHVGTDIADLGKTLAQSERFATGWVHKLCVYANAAVCDPSGNNLRDPADPEFLRIVAAFKDSGYNWNTLVQELFSSPLITYASETDTVRERGMSFPVAKKAQLCKLFDQRLGLKDVCGLVALPSTATGDPIKTIATVLPADSYSRGQTLPTLANDPGLFFYAGVENMCVALSTRVVDAASGESKWRSADTTAAISGMVHELMGVSGERAQQAIDLLTAHVADARSDGADASAALRSAFMLACMSPTVVGVGQ